MPAEADRAAERALFTRLRAGDQRAREELVERFLPLAKHLAGRYRNSSEPMDDLIQVASLGLVKAIDRYDISRPTAFSSFAVPTIAGELKRHFRDKSWSVRVPRELQETSLKLDKAIGELSEQLGRSPSVPELADELDLTVEQVLEAMEAGQARHASSLMAPRGSEGGDGGMVIDVLADDQRADAYELAEQRVMVADLMSDLDAREQEVLRLRFSEDLTQSEIGERLGISQMQVSRIIRRCLAELRSAAGEDSR